jgi:hypothetical protein
VRPIDTKFRGSLEAKWVLAVCLGLIGDASTVIAQTTGTFTATGSMTTPRLAHTATLLRDGRVLIAGGLLETRTNARLASAELYDPATGTFIATGNMTVARVSNHATLLADGRVLIFGTPGTGGPATAELYDPFTGTFTATGSTVNAQDGPTVTLLGNGKVLIAGGVLCCSPPWNIIVGAELYDPSTGVFTQTGGYGGTGSAEYIGGPDISQSTLLPDGRVLLAGEPNSELYDPVTGTFSLTGDMITQSFGKHRDHVELRFVTKTLVLRNWCPRRGRPEIVWPQVRFREVCCDRHRITGWHPCIGQYHHEQRCASL